VRVRGRRRCRKEYREGERGRGRGREKESVPTTVAELKLRLSCLQLLQSRHRPPTSSNPFLSYVVILQTVPAVNRLTKKSFFFFVTYEWGK